MGYDPGRKFVVLSSQRSGSTWLVSMLSQLEDATAFGELFLPRKRDTEVNNRQAYLNYPRFVEIEPHSKIRPISVFTYLNQLYCQPGAVGFKLMDSQIEMYPEIAAYLYLHRIWVVHLVRRNYLDVIISQALMHKTNQAHIVSTKSVPKNIQIEIDVSDLVNRLHRKDRKIKALRVMLGMSRLPILEVAYEDLVKDPSAFLRICNFLSINSKGEIPQSALVKINRKRHSELISNYEEVKNTLAGTPYAHFIE